MTEKAFRLDFLIAIAALLVSAISAVALLYQTRVVADQYAATIWPYVNSEGTFGPASLSYHIENYGLGPALIQSAQLLVDSKPVSGWSDYFKAILKDPDVRAFFLQRRADALAGRPVDGVISTKSIGPGTTVRPGDSLQLMKIELAGAPFFAMSKHTVDFRLCYCSLNRSCWTFDSAAKGSKQTEPVATCTSSSSIAPAAFTSPSAPPHKKSP